MTLYNLFPLLAGPFSCWPGHFKRAAEMGFDWIFVNPIQKPGSSGSLYSIADYRAIHPKLLDPGSKASPDEQVKRMIAEAKKAGLKVMIDLVINHCAFDSPLTREHPEWFVRGADGKLANASCEENGQRVVWGDLVLFDHAHTSDPEGLYGYVRGVVEHLLSLGFEGFRCDAAYQVPSSVWRRLIGEIKSRQPACFVAETLGCGPDQTRDTAGAGFDFIFNSSKWWNFTDPWLLEQYNSVRQTVGSISFPESHDTPRLAEELNGNVEGLKQRYFFAAFFSAGVMIPIGFEFGFRKRLDVVRTTPGDWENSTGIDLTGYISKVNAIKKSHALLKEEGPDLVLESPNPNILLMRKQSATNGAESLLILNKDVGRHQDFYAERFRPYMATDSRLEDVSPEFPLDQVREPFRYGLRPGQGIILVNPKH